MPDNLHEPQNKNNDNFVTLWGQKIVVLVRQIGEENVYNKELVNIPSDQGWK